MENIIKKAIEGGWSTSYVSLYSGKYYEKYVLDPLFWQSLGKACGWHHVGTIPENEPFVYIALNFHEKNLTIGWDSAVEWLEELVGKE